MMMSRRRSKFSMIRFIIILLILGLSLNLSEATFISVHGSITCCEKPAISCNYPESAVISLNEWPRRILIRSEYASDGSYQISWNHSDDYLIDPFIEINVECSFGNAILKDSLPVYGGIIEKDFEITNSELSSDY